MTVNKECYRELKAAYLKSFKCSRKDHWNTLAKLNKKYGPDVVDQCSVLLRRSFR